MIKPKKRVLITLAKEIHDGGKKRAKTLNRSFSNMVEELIDYEIANLHLAKMKIRQRKKFK